MEMKQSKKKKQQICFKWRIFFLFKSLLVSNEV